MKTNKKSKFRNHYQVLITYFI